MRGAGLRGDDARREVVGPDAAIQKIRNEKLPSAHGQAPGVIQPEREDFTLRNQLLDIYFITLHHTSS